MDLRPLPFSSTLREYQEQAAGLLQAYRDGDPEALRQIHHHHPRFLDAEIPWLPKDVADSDIQAAGLELADAELTLARCYDFRDWPALTQFVETVGDGNSPVFRFEAAVEAVIHGELA